MPSPVFSSPRLVRQIAFLAEIDKLKEILRQSVVTTRDGTIGRRENSAEHSWHLAMLAVVLAEHSPVPLDLGKIVKMVLVHDIIEIDAGDTFIYDTAGNASKAERELAAAARLFPLLPADQAAELRAWWDEFEAGESAESKAAQALDRMAALLQNLHTEGITWREHGVTKAQVLERNAKIGKAFPGLWEEIVRQIDWAEAQGWLA
ncbi:putative hydrolases of HD superfamily [Verrucomicrobium sp. GAS474]|uniref:HD domain-containing protein n=1 Tax=Verrucomicrobium sp. GAS474 TaxID=1882831 RepID=UPI00087B5C23|nr:HD domain-containing protein [Verrucomicrobium sp. GAS474]SDT86517.1 putative hydrolases of HD superfamily [Verrucomicrobium sp. GAS474]